MEVGRVRGIVLAAGLGTRLRPLTWQLPKPAVPFFGRPIASWTVDHLASAGVCRLVANTHHLPEVTEGQLAGALHPSVSLAFSRERDLLGTAGGVRRAWEVSEARYGRMSEDETMLVMNGDIVFAPDLEELVRVHRAANAEATLVVRHSDDAFTKGAIEHAGGRIERLLGRTASDGLESSMFTGVHALTRRALERLPTEGCIVRQGYAPWLAEGLRLGAVVSAAGFRDVGTIAEYVAAHRDVLEGRHTLPGLDEHGARVGSSWVAHATVAPKSFSLEHSVIGKQVEFVGGGVLEGCVVWDGVRVTGSRRNCVQTPNVEVELAS